MVIMAQRYRRYQGTMIGRIWLIGIVVCLSRALSSQAYMDNNQLAQGFDNRHDVSRSFPILQRQKRDDQLCTSVNCSSVGGGGSCVAAADGSANYTCSSCLYGSNVKNGPCPMTPCTSVNCNSTGGGGSCVAAANGTANYTCSSCVDGSDVTNGPCQPPGPPVCSLSYCCSSTYYYLYYYYSSTTSNNYYSFPYGNYIDGIAGPCIYNGTICNCYHDTLDFPDFGPPSTVIGYACDNASYVGTIGNPHYDYDGGNYRRGGYGFIGHDFNFNGGYFGYVQDYIPNAPSSAPFPPPGACLPSSG